MNMINFPECMYVYFMCAWYSWRSEERVVSPRTEVVGGYELLCGTREPTQVLCKSNKCLTSAPPLQPETL